MQINGMSMGRNRQMRPKYDNIKHVENPQEVLRKLQSHLSSRKESLGSRK